MENRSTSSSSLSAPPNRIEEVPTSFYRSTTEQVDSFDVPLRSSGKSAAITALRENREREKRELSQLNDRFASYIDRVRFLEKDNKKLQGEIDQLRDKWGSQTHSIRDKYDVEIHDVRRLIDEAAKDRATAELRAKRAEEEAVKIREKCEILLAEKNADRAKIQLLEQQLLTNQADLDLFHRRLVDLEDEQKRTHHESQQMNTDLNRITRELDHETIARVELENHKQTLEDEIHFLKKVHAEEVEELKQMNLIGTSLDPTKFFKNELSNAVQHIREEYEQLNQQQRIELQSWYQMKVTQAIEEIQSRRAIEKAENAREQEEIKNLRTSAVDLQQDLMTTRRRNGELVNRIHELEELIQTERKNNRRANDDRDQQIRELTHNLHDLERDYDELVETKSSLDSEISIYRKLLENEEKRENFKSIINHARADSSLTGESTVHPRSYQRTNDSQELGEHSLSDGHSDTGHGRSSKSDHEHVSSTIHQESIGLRDSRESSDGSFDADHSILTSYTPARPLLSTRTEPTIFDQVYGSRLRRPISIGLNSRWVPVTNYSSTYTWQPSDVQSRRIKIRTCFDTTTRRQQQKPKAVTPPSSDYTDAYLSTFAPKSSYTRRIYRIAAPVFANVAPVTTFLPTDNEIKTSTTRFNHASTISTSNSFEKILPTLAISNSTHLSSLTPKTIPKYEFVSNPPAQLRTSDTVPLTRPTSFYDNQPSKTTVQLSSQSPSSAIPSIDQVDSSTRKVEKSFPSPSSQLPSISPTISPTKIIYKPAVVFQAAPSPFSKNISQFAADERSVESLSSTPKVVHRPETLIFQPDEDTNSSSLKKPSPFITPSPDSLNICAEEKTTPELPSLTEESTTASISSKPIEILEQTLTKYDTIIDQISSILASVSPLSSTVSSMSPGKSALDYEMTANGSPVLSHKHIEPDLPSEPTTTIVTTMTTARGKGKYLIRDDSYDKLLATIADLDNELTPPPENENITRTTTVEQKAIRSEPDQSNTPAEMSDETSSSKKSNKRVTWGDVIVNSEDDESSLPASFTEEITPSETPFFLMRQDSLGVDQSTTIIQQDSDLFEPVANISVVDQQSMFTTSMELVPPVIKRRIPSSSSPDTSSSVSDYVDRQTTSSEFNESQSSQDEQIISSASSNEVHFILPVTYPQQTASATLSNIESSIDTLPGSISTVHLSGDVDQGDHVSLTENLSSTDNKNTTIALVASLRQTIAAPATPLIETIQNVISTMRTVTASKPPRDDQEMTVTNLIVTDFQNEQPTQTPEESKTILESIDDKSVESEQDLVPNLQTNQQQVMSSTNRDSIEFIPETSSTIEEGKNSTEDKVDLSEETVDESKSMPTIAHDFDQMKTTQNVIPADQSTISTSTTEEHTDPFVSEISQILRGRSADVDEKQPVPNINTINTSSLTDDVNVAHDNSVVLDTTVSSDLVIPLTSEKIDDRTREEIIQINTTPNTSDILTPAPIDIQTSFDGTPNSFVLTAERIAHVLNSFVREEEQIQPTYGLSQVIVDEVAQSTVPHQSSDAILTTDDIIMSDDADKKTISASSTMTEFTLSSDKSDIPTAKNQDHEMDQQITTSEWSHPLYQTNHGIVSSDSGLTQSTLTQIDESMKTETSNLLDNPCEQSPTNTEPDSLELINALRGHSILHEYSPDYVLHQPEKSSSTTTSSQITSSDRYVSYAIHQMGDSSQDRLPSFPLAADLPVYKYINENSPPNLPVTSPKKEDDSTEFDASDNFNYQSDDILFQKLQHAAMKRQRNLNASSTDDDVDDELEQHDLTNLEDIIDKLDQPMRIISIDEEPYHRYELATTPSSNESSSSSAKRPVDDIYYIPGYSGLWRPSEGHNNENISIDYDADDERRSTPRIRKHTRGSCSRKQNSSFVNQPKTTMESEGRLLDEGLPDPSESDSYRTCPSSNVKTIEKTSEETNRTVSDDNLYLIHQRERGVSLPILMKIDCNELTLRLSTSSPIETQLHPIAQRHSSSSSSTHSEPPRLLKPVSSDPASSISLSSHESDVEREPSWLNTINTITTTTEGTDGPLESQVILDKSAKGPLNICECHAQGNYIIIKNTSRSKMIDLTGWKIHQENENGDQCMFTFPNHCLLKPNHSLKILSKTSQSEQRNDDLIAYSLSSWQTGLHILTILINPEGKDCATLTRKTIIS